MNSLESDKNENELRTEGSGIDLYYLIGALWSYKKFIFLTTTTVAILSIIYVLTATKSYMSKVTLYPITRDQGGPLKELAASLGLGVKPEGYYLPDVIYSRRISKKVMGQKYLVDGQKDSLNLYQLWEIDQNEPSGLELEKALKFLDMCIDVREDKETALITLTVTTNNKKLSADIAQAYVDMITQYLQNELKAQIQSSIFFTGLRLDEVSKEMFDAIEDLILFQEKNSKIASPSLLSELRLKQKNIDIIQNLQELLRKQYELLKIEEERLKPVMNILDPPDQYHKAIKPRKKATVMLNTVLTFLISFVLVLVKEKAERDDIFKKLKKVLGFN